MKSGRLNGRTVGDIRELKLHERVVLEIVTVSRKAGGAELRLVGGDLADTAGNGAGYGLRGLDVKYRWDEHRGEAYYFVNDQTGGDLVSYGFSWDGCLAGGVDYLFEYGTYDPEGAGAAGGTAWLAGLAASVGEFDVTALYGKGEEEYRPVADVYYWHRYQDMFGRLANGTLPEGRTFATGSLAGIEDALLRVETDITGQTRGCFVHERATRSAAS